MPIATLGFLGMAIVCGCADDLTAPEGLAAYPGPRGPPTEAETHVGDECWANGGTDCDPERCIAEQAALCLAERGGLGPGLRPPTANLLFHFGYKTVVWNVSVVTRETGPAAVQGDRLTVNATTGALLGAGGFAGTP